MNCDIPHNMMINAMVSITKICNRLPLSPCDDFNLSVLNGYLWRKIEKRKWMRDQYLSKSMEVLKPLHDAEKERIRKEMK